MGPWALVLAAMAAVAAVAPCGAHASGLAHVWLLDGPAPGALANRIAGAPPLRAVNTPVFEQSGGPAHQGDAAEVVEATESFLALTPGVGTPELASLALAAVTISLRFKVLQPGVLVSRAAAGALQPMPGDIEVLVTESRSLVARVWHGQTFASFDTLRTVPGAVRDTFWHSLVLSFGPDEDGVTVHELHLDGERVARHQASAVFDGWLTNTNGLGFGFRAGPDGPADPLTGLLDSIVVLDGLYVPAKVTRLLACFLDTPCANSAACIPNASLALGYSCECTPGWEGPHCESDIDACAISPCGAFFVCVDKPPPATIGATERDCTVCGAGFTGDEPCTNVDACTGFPCDPNSAGCSDLDPPAPNSRLGRTCGPCLPGFVGDGDACTPICANGVCVTGDCLLLNASASVCQNCALGRAGPRCERDERPTVVTPWSAWTPCSATCGSFGVRTRTRELIKGPSIGFQALALQETRGCNEYPCAGVLALVPVQPSFVHFDDTAGNDGVAGLVVWPPLPDQPGVVGVRVSVGNRLGLDRAGAQREEVGVALATATSIRLPTAMAALGLDQIYVAYWFGRDNESSIEFSTEVDPAASTTKPLLPAWLLWALVAAGVLILALILVLVLAFKLGSGDDDHRHSNEDEWHWALDQPLRHKRRGSFTWQRSTPAPPDTMPPPTRARRGKRGLSLQKAGRDHRPPSVKRDNPIYTDTSMVSGQSSEVGPITYEMTQAAPERRVRPRHNQLQRHPAMASRSPREYAIAGSFGDTDDGAVPNISPYATLDLAPATLSEDPDFEFEFEPESEGIRSALDLRGSSELDIMFGRRTSVPGTSLPPPPDYEYDWRPESDSSGPSSRRRSRLSLDSMGSLSGGRRRESLGESPLPGYTDVTLSRTGSVAALRTSQANMPLPLVPGDPHRPRSLSGVVSRSPHGSPHSRRSQRTIRTPPARRRQVEEGVEQISRAMRRLSESNGSGLGSPPASPSSSPYTHLSAVNKPESIYMDASANLVYDRLSSESLGVSAPRQNPRQPRRDSRARPRERSRSRAFSLAGYAASADEQMAAIRQQRSQEALDHLLKTVEQFEQQSEGDEDHQQRASTLRRIILNAAESSLLAHEGVDPTHHRPSFSHNPTTLASKPSKQ